ncbi:malonate transporter [Actibacterium mucosum KCTC 23349]|uniref:Malonate transporter n=1 Tax=Actibacterium mucosum KCTC 23349 TaxID=1454373 RepID=A0A037ZHN0_9RHOB|nr:AEC family transporter [Actibacterium mucosum]KAJ55915.1 malonate transporter [Actibacterium mucosum KCTC 23349]
MALMVQVILPVAILVACGYLAARFRVLGEAAVDGLMLFSQKFAIPCLLFAAIARLDLATQFRGTLLASYYVGALCVFTLGFLGARFLFGRPWQDSVAIGFAAFFSNSVLLGLPVTERAYGADALQANFALISINAPLCYCVGVTAMELLRFSGASSLVKLRAVLSAMFSNVLVVAIMCGFVVNLGAIPVPDTLWQVIDMAAAAALPVALFGLGGVLLRYRPEGDMATILFICALSLLINPAIVWTMGQTLDLTTAQFRSAVITAAMAPGVNVYLFADFYGVGRRVAASSVLLGTVLSILSVWMWLSILP